MIAGRCLCGAVTHQIAEYPVVCDEFEPDSVFDDWISAKKRWSSTRDCSRPWQPFRLDTVERG